MKDFILEFYGYAIFFYSMGLILSYAALMWLAELSILKSKKNNLESYAKIY